MENENTGAFKKIDDIEEKILLETRANPSVRLDPHWSPHTTNVLDLAKILARSYINKNKLLRGGGSIGQIEDINSLIIEQHRWLRNKGLEDPEKIPTVDVLRRDYYNAGVIRELHRESGEDVIEDYIADLNMGVCHLIAEEFYGGNDALFQDK